MACNFRPLCATRQSLVWFRGLLLKSTREKNNSIVMIIRRCEVRMRNRRRIPITFGLKQESIGRQSPRSKDLFTSYFSKAVHIYSTFAAAFVIYCSSLSSAKGWVFPSRPIYTMGGTYWGVIEVHNRRCQDAGTWRGRGINRRSCLRKESHGHVGVPTMEMSTSFHPERDVSSQQTGLEPLWLGLDLSTQSLTGAILKGYGKGGAFNEPLVLESVNFEVRHFLQIDHVLNGSINRRTHCTSIFLH